MKLDTLRAVVGAIAFAVFSTAGQAAAAIADQPRPAQMASYSDPALPVSPALVTTLVGFLRAVPAR